MRNKAKLGRDGAFGQKSRARSGRVASGTCRTKPISPAAEKPVGQAPPYVQDAVRGRTTYEERIVRNKPNSWWRESEGKCFMEKGLRGIEPAKELGKTKPIPGDARMGRVLGDGGRGVRPSPLPRPASGSSRGRLCKTNPISRGLAGWEWVPLPSRNRTYRGKQSQLVDRMGLAPHRKRLERPHR